MFCFNRGPRPWRLVTSCPFLIAPGANLLPLPLLSKRKEEFPGSAAQIAGVIRGAGRGMGSYIYSREVKVSVVFFETIRARGIIFAGLEPGMRRLAAHGRRVGHGPIAVAGPDFPLTGPNTRATLKMLRKTRQRGATHVFSRSFDKAM